MRKCVGEVRERCQVSVGEGCGEGVGKRVRCMEKCKRVWVGVRRV